jgi:hypothetical protein
LPGSSTPPNHASELDFCSVALAAKQLQRPERSCHLQLFNCPITVEQYRVKILFLLHARQTSESHQLDTQ